MNTSPRRHVRRLLPIAVAAATSATLLIVPSAAIAADITGSCEVVSTADGNVVVLEQATGANAQLIQNKKWVANITGLDSYLDARDDSPADTYKVRLRQSGTSTDIPCEAGQAEEPQPQAEPAPAPAPIALPECQYVISDGFGTVFEFANGSGSLNLRNDTSWVKTVTGMTTTTLDTIGDVGYTLIHRVSGTMNTIDCVNVTPEPAPEPAPVVEDCVISELLVPSCGAWLGASTPTFGTNGTSPQGLDEYESVTGHTPDVLHFYKRNDQAWPTAREIALAERPDQEHPSLLFYNWKPSTSLTWAQIADGKADRNIAVVAENLKNYPNKLWLAIYHEPEDNVVMTEGSGMTPADYVAMFRHTVQQLEAHGVTNAVYTWNLMGFQRWWPMFEALYPGDDVVDWVCYDPYQQGRNHNLSLLLDGDTGHGTYSRLAEIAPEKPMCLAEWGVDVNLDNPVGFFDDTDADAVLAAFPQMKMLLYWNAAHKGSYSLNTPTDKGRALAAGYADFAKAPVFNGMDPSNVAS